MRRATLALALAPVLAGPAAGAVAASSGPDPAPATTHQAPPSDSHATAVKLDNLLKVGDTSSHAGDDGGSADADALDLGGNTLIDGKTGGSQKVSGSSSGALIDTGATPLGSLAVTPWKASAKKDDSGSSSAADAALAHLTVIDDKTLDVWLLHSQSDSSWTAGESKSSSTSDGASVNAGDGALEVLVLHSKSESGGKGSSALVSINGNDIGSSDQANGSCALSIPQVAQLTCLDASGGKGSNGGQSTADGATATLGDSKEPQGVITGVGSKGTKAPTAVEGTKTTNNRHRQSQADRTPNTPSGAQGLPFTGFNAGLISAYGAALAGLGAAIVRAGRRRKGHALR